MPRSWGKSRPAAGDSLSPILPRSGPRSAKQIGPTRRPGGIDGIDGSQRCLTHETDVESSCPYTCDADPPGGPTGRRRSGRISSEQRIGGEEGIRTLDTALDRITV